MPRTSATRVKCPSPFDVFCAVGYRAGRPRIWRAEAFSTARPANWSAFLGSLPGDPKRIVCDAHGGMLQAIGERWPEAELHQCEWHLQHAHERLLAKEARNDPSEELGELRARRGCAHRPVLLAAVCARSPSRREREPRSLDRRNGPTIYAQFARRPPPSRYPTEMPLTTSALEQLTRPIVAAPYPRRYALKNRERLNRLLLLHQLHVSGDDDVHAYAKAIRAWLESNGGRPAALQRAIADRAGMPSLR